MKPRLLSLVLSLSALLYAAPMYMPLVATSIETSAMGGVPAIRASIRLTDDWRSIVLATLRIGEDIIEIPAEALNGIEFPDLSTLRIEVEEGRDGRRWVSIVLLPLRQPEPPVRFHISVIDGVFTQVTRTWDEVHERHIHRQREFLHPKPSP